MAIDNNDFEFATLPLDDINELDAQLSIWSINSRNLETQEKDIKTNLVKNILEDINSITTLGYDRCFAKVEFTKGGGSGGGGYSKNC